MAIPAYFAAGDLAVATSGNVAPALPVNTAPEDVAYLAVMTNAGNTFPSLAGAGWEDLGTPINSANQSSRWYWRRLDGTAADTPAPFTIASGTALGTGNGLYARIYVFRGAVSTGTPHEAVANAGAPTTTNAPQSSAVATGGANRLVVSLVVVDDNNLGWASGMPPGAWSNAGPSQGTNTGGDCQTDGICIERAAQGTEPAVTIGTMSAADYWRTLSFALLPGGPTTVNGTAATTLAVTAATTGIPEKQGTSAATLGLTATATGTTPGLVLWRRPESLPTDAAVSSWPEDSGHGSTATQDTSTEQPARVAAGLDGYAVVDFDGADDLLDQNTGDILAVTNGAASILYVAVVKYDLVDAGLVRDVFAISSNFNINQLRFKCGWRTPAGTPIWALSGRGIDNGEGRNLESATPIDTNWHRVSWQVDYGANRARIWLGNDLIAESISFFTTGGNISATNALSAKTGARQDGVGEFMLGRLAEDRLYVGAAPIADSVRTGFWAVLDAKYPTAAPAGAVNGTAGATLGITADAAGATEELGAAAATLGITGAVAGQPVPPVLGAAAASMEVMATVAGTVTGPTVVPGTAAATLEVTATAAGLAEPLGQAAASLAITATVAGTVTGPTVVPGMAAATLEVTAAVVGITVGWGPPQTLEAVAVTTGQIDLTWTAVPGATGYDIERDGSVIEWDHPTNSYSDIGLQAGTLYTYRVRAVDALMTGDFLRDSYAELGGP